MATRSRVGWSADGGAPDGLDPPPIGGPPRRAARMPTLSGRALGRPQASLSWSGVSHRSCRRLFLITREVGPNHRVRGGARSHEAWTRTARRHDPDVVDDQAPVVHVRGRGWWSSPVAATPEPSTSRDAQPLTGVVTSPPSGGPASRRPSLRGPVIGPTVQAFTAMDLFSSCPGLTGWQGTARPRCRPSTHTWTTSSFAGSSYRIDAA